MSKSLTPAECIEYNKLVEFWNSHDIAWNIKNEHLAELRKKDHEQEFWLHEEWVPEFKNT